MRKLLLGAGLLAGAAITLPGRAQSNWYTPEVAQQLGYVFSLGQAPGHLVTTCLVGPHRVAASQLAVFDTIATYVQGRVVDRRTGQPLAGASVVVTYRSLGAGCCEQQATTTDARGFFRSGWVGTSGPAGGRNNRTVQVQAAKYPPLNTQQVSFGGGVYLHVELSAQ